MRKIIQLSLIPSVLVLSACGDGTSPSVEQADTATLDTIYITAVDTIGVEFGQGPDVFAFLVEVGYTPDGNIAVLDAQKTRLQIFNPQGEEMMQIGRSGQGPGEYQMPLGLAILGSGYVVSDLAGAKLVRFDSAGTFMDEITGFFPIPPVSIAGTGGESFLAQQIAIDISNDHEPQGFVKFAAFRDSSEPEVVFESYPMDMSGGSSSSDAQLHFAGGIRGESFLVEESDSLFLLAGFTGTGEEIFRVSEEWERIPLAEEELAEDQLSISLSMNSEGNTLETSREPVTDQYRSIIENVGVDSQGRIWVKMGDMDTPYFRVYSAAGEQIAVAIPDESISEKADYSISPNGLMAFDSDPDDWPKIYLLEVSE